MGVDCKLLVPADWSLSGTTNVWLATILPLGRVYEDFDRLEACPTKPLPGPLWEAQLSHDEQRDCHNERALTVDSYGRPLVTRRAVDVAVALAGQSMSTKAAVAYLSALPPDYPIVCYWC